MIKVSWTSFIQHRIRSGVPFMRNNPQIAGRVRESRHPARRGSSASTLEHDII